MQLAIHKSIRKVLRAETPELDSPSYSHPATTNECLCMQTKIDVWGKDSDSIQLVVWRVEGNLVGDRQSIDRILISCSGLFHRILLMSGTAVSPGIVRDSAINATWALDKKLHCRFDRIRTFFEYKLLWDISYWTSSAICFHDFAEKFQIIQFVRITRMFSQATQGWNSGRRCEFFLEV